MKAALRKLALLGLSFAVVAAVVLIYSRIAGPQGTPSSTPDSPGSNGPSTLEPTIKRIGGRERTLQRGEKVEIYLRGPGGRIQREYHIERLILQSEDRASLEDVRFVWHFKDGQTLTLTSQSGQVHIERGALGSAQPTRGLLTGNVRIVFDASPEDQPKQRPLGQRDADKFIITTPQLDFDIPSCRLSTDQPVQLRGARLDAYGTGLLLRWREISNDIDTLNIKKGGQLTWYPGPQRGPAAPTPPEDQEEQEEQKTQTATQAPLPLEPAKQKTPPKKLDSYLATFHDHVRLTYQDQVVENVDRLEVYFNLDGSDKADSAAEDTQPSPKTPSKPGASEPSVQPGASEHQPAVAELQPPLHLTWTGPMIIVPDEEEDHQRRVQRKFEAKAFGAPVKFSSNDMSGECARLEAEHHSGIVRLFSSPEFPVILNGTDGTEITCKEQIDIDFSDSRVATATLGKGSLKSSGRALSPSSSEPGQDSKPITLSWDGQAELKFLEDTHPLKDRPKSDPTETQSDYYLAEATAQKNVQAVSDKFNASAHYMHIELGPPGSDGTERGQGILLLRAKDNFFSVLSDDNRSISADSMKTHFTRRRSGRGQFPSSIELNGHVLASQPPQQYSKKSPGPSPQDQPKSTLQCQEMDITLIEPDDVTTSSTDSYAAARISHLLARGQVIGRYEPEGADPSNLSAHTLEWDLATKTTTLKGGPARVELEHPKDEQGKEKDEKDWLESEIIEIVEKDRPNGDEGTYYVLSTPGRGKMRTSFAGSEEGAEP
ncbi:MAG: hypothetical protein KAT11_05670, partial [Phycisphaerae bacterium]|nr:hypothetical protein [Phycisphaerae bacterium]